MIPADDWRGAEYSVTCPVCGARPSYPCRSITTGVDNALHDSHGARQTAFALIRAEGWR